MKSAEEILSKYYTPYTSPPIRKDDIIEAMNEYARQSCDELRRRIKQRVGMYWKKLTPDEICDIIDNY